MEDFSIFAKIKADTSDFTKGINDAKSSIESLSGKSFKGLETAIDKVLGPKGKLAIALVSVSTLMAKFGQEFNNITNDIIKGTGALGKDLLSLEGSAKKALVNGFGGDLKTVGGIVADLNTRFGVTDKTLEQMTLDFDKFARITGSDTKQAVSEVADVVAKWGMNVNDTTPLLNQLVVASQKSGASVQELLSGLKSGQAIFSQFGFSATQTIAYLSSLKKNGIDTTTVISSMKIALSNFAKQGIEAGEGLKQITSQIQNAETETEALNIAVAIFGQRNAPEMVRVLRSGTVSAEEFSKSLETAGGTLDKLDKYIITSGQSLKKLGNELKGTFSGFGQGFDLLFAGLFDALASIVRTVEPIITPIANIFKEVFGFVGEILRVTIANISTFVTKYSQGFQTTVNVLTRTYEAVHNILETILDNFKDVFGIIFSILDGQWALVWEYFKKTMMNSAKIILDVASSIANIFKDMINQIIIGLNKGIREYNKFVENAEKEHPNLSKIFGLKKETEISLIGDLDLSKLTGLEGALDKTTQKIKELSGESEKELIGDLGKVKNVVQDVAQTVEDSGEEIIEVSNNWDKKLLQQSISMLEMEKRNAVERAEISGATEEQIAEINNKYDVQILERKKELLEQERELELSKIEDSENAGEARMKINAFYDNEIEMLNDELLKKKNNKQEEKDEETKLGKMFRMTSQYAKNAIKVFKNIAGTIKKVFEKIGSVVKSAFSGIFSIIKKLVDFSINDALDSLLKFEDGILTFFVETLPMLPQFLESAFNSVITLLDTLESSIDYEKIEKDLSSMINTLTTNLPKAFESATNIISNSLNSMFGAIQTNAPEIVNAFGSMFFTVAEALPGIIDNLFATIGSLLSELGKYLTANKDRFETALKNIISSIINGISEFVKTGGWRNLLQGLLAVQQAIENAVADNIEEIGNTIVSLLPDLMDFLKKSIVSASKTLGRIAPTLFKIIIEIIVGIIDVITSDEVIESSLEAIEGLIEGLVPAIVKIFTKVLPQLIEFSLIKLPSYTPMIITHVITGLIKGFAEVDWWQTIKDIFNGFVEAFKDFFGIHSPSTLFEGFGTNIIEGLVIGLQGFADAVKTILEPIFKFINDGFGKVLDTIAELTKISFDGFNEGLSNILDAVTKLLNPVDTLKATFDGLKTLLNSVSDLMKTSAKITISTLGAVVKAIADVHNELRDIIKSVTTIKVWTPWKTYEIGGVDIGKVSSPNIDSYLNIVDKLATGTNNARKGLTLVGEAGPELVNFRGGEQVYNNHNTEKMLAGAGGNTNNFNVTFQNTQDTTAFAMLQQLKAYNRQMAINGVL